MPDNFPDRGETPAPLTPNIVASLTGEGLTPSCRKHRHPFSFSLEAGLSEESVEGSGDESEGSPWNSSEGSIEGTGSVLSEELGDIVFTDDEIGSDMGYNTPNPDNIEGREAADAISLLSKQNCKTSGKVKGEEGGRPTRSSHVNAPSALLGPHYLPPSTSIVSEDDSTVASVMHNPGKDTLFYEMGTEKTRYTDAVQGREVKGEGKVEGELKLIASSGATQAWREKVSPSVASELVPTATCKILVVGNAKCGKTSIIRRFVSDSFCVTYNSTVGADYAMKDLTVQGGERVRLQLWDIAGQDRFAKLTRAYFRRAKGAIVVCDVTREGTFDALEIDSWCQNEGCKLPVYLLANKSDLLDDVQDSFLAGAKMEKTCRETGFTEWYLTSAKSGNNIETAMQDLVTNALQAEKQRLEGAAELVSSGTERVGREAPFQLSRDIMKTENYGVDVARSCCT